MDDMIESYLRIEKNASDSVIDSIMAKLDSNPDIKAEFESWLKTRSYSDVSAIKVDDYSAEDIAGMAPFLDGIGSYMFLITLRTDPVKAKEIIRSGFNLFQ